MGTKVSVSYQRRTVVVKINDFGSGDGTMARVLDLSKAAYAYLVGSMLHSINNRTAGVIAVNAIHVVPQNTPLGPVIHEKK